MHAPVAELTLRLGLGAQASAEPMEAPSEETLGPGPNSDGMALSSVVLMATHIGFGRRCWILDTVPYEQAH